MRSFIALTTATVLSFGFGALCTAAGANGIAANFLVGFGVLAVFAYTLALFTTE